MKKNMKKVLSLGLISAMAVVSLAGCGKKGGDSSEFLIGGLGPLSGPAASYGTSVKQGAEIAIDEINKGAITYKTTKEGIK
jgi:branched-chain amino acid transport system substrate-binding protein